MARNALGPGLALACVWAVLLLNRFTPNCLVGKTGDFGYSPVSPSAEKNTYQS